jgi:hypothetical protein
MHNVDRFPFLPGLDRPTPAWQMTCRALERRGSGLNKLAFDDSCDFEENEVDFFDTLSLYCFDLIEMSFYSRGMSLPLRRDEDNDRVIVCLPDCLRFLNLRTLWLVDCELLEVSEILGIASLRELHLASMKELKFGSFQKLLERGEHQERRDLPIYCTAKSIRFQRDNLEPVSFLWPQRFPAEIRSCNP